jgi:acylphosphatase
MRMTVVFRGCVQNVGFRYTVEDFSHNFLVQGYVQNHSDGSVELVAESEEKELKQFMSTIQFEFKENISDYQTTWGPGTGEFKDFRIRY